MDKHTVADIDAHVAYVAGTGVEAENVAGLQLVHMYAVSGLVIGNAVESVAKLTIDIVDKA